MNVQYNHVGFNAEWVASQKINDFLEHEKHQRLTEKQLREAYKLCKEAVTNKDSSFQCQQDSIL
jgi:uncharacterized protein YnzC (UPF0291/DUF896 family)